MTQWQPIETAPKDKEILLGNLNKATLYWAEAGRWYGVVGWYTLVGGKPINSPTHWAVLPS